MVSQSTKYNRLRARRASRRSQRVRPRAKQPVVRVFRLSEEYIRLRTSYVHLTHDAEVEHRIRLINPANAMPETNAPILTDLDIEQLLLHWETTDVPADQNIPLPLPRRRHAVVAHKVTYKLAQITQNVESVEPYDLGRLENECGHCGALYFNEEVSNRRTDYRPCCGKGKIVLPPLRGCPAELQHLLTADGHNNILFRDHIRLVNCLFAMASFKTSNPDTGRPANQGHWCMNVCGQIYHFAEPLPSQTQVPDAQLNTYYFLDAESALNRRVDFASNRVPDAVLHTISDMLQRENPWVQSYMTMAEVITDIRRRRHQDPNFDGEPLADVVLAFKDTMSAAMRTYNLPTSRSDIAAVFVGEEPPFQVDLKVYPKQHDGHTELKNLNKLADPMVYPLLFPRGEVGYDYRIKLSYRRAEGEDELVGELDYLPPEDEEQPKKRKYVSIREFYRYRLQMRREFSIIHNGGKLFQQYVVDAWVRAESNDLWYLKEHQQEIRVVNRAGIRRMLEQRASAMNATVGLIRILPPTIKGSQRDLNRKYLDALALVARYGKPDLFVTFTCNPNWKEIQENLVYKQKWEHRPDLVCRVFHAKLMQLIDDLVNKQIFGVVLYYIYVIEFQKRGLPHAHIIICLRPEDRLTTEDDVNATISAVIPHRNEKKAYSLVCSHFVHRPCGEKVNPDAPCMRDGKCSKYYPKKFVDRTRLVGNNPLGQPDYQRPDDGRHIIMGNTVIDNRRVIPHNKYLAAKYDSHLNVECCGSIFFIKYLFKYVEKGHDHISIQAATVDHQQPSKTAQKQTVINWDEISAYQNYRYVSSPEAIWRIFEFAMSDRSHSVIPLPIHLPGEQDVIVRDDDNADTIAQKAEKPTKLMAWFILNQTDVNARQYRYAEIPEHYVWEYKSTSWRARKQIGKTIGVLVEVSLTDKEKFYLRMLLSHINGAQSFEELRTVNGVLCPNFETACRRLHLLADTNEYDKCMEEAAITKSAYQLRNLFGLICCIVLADGGVDMEMIQRLWEKYQARMSEDFIHREKGLSTETATKMSLYHIKRVLQRSFMGQKSLSDIGLNEVDVSDPAFAKVLVCATDFLRSKNQEIDVIQHEPTAVEFSRKLNAGQLSVYNAIMSVVYKEMALSLDDGPNLFFIDGPGGTGKTFLYNVIVDVIEKVLQFKVISVAWTGIASLLLKGGKTVHSAFKLPLKITRTTIGGFPEDSEQAQYIKDAIVIIWDEAPMSNRYAVEAVDRYLRLLMRRPNTPMGGKIVIFGGDFRQLLPVVPRGHQGEVVDHSLVRSPLWNCIRKFHLYENMRAHLRANNADGNNFAKFLMNLGDGKLPIVAMPQKASPNAPKDLIEIPKHHLVYSLAELYASTFGSDAVIGASVTDRRVILTPTNRAVDLINTELLSRIPGTERIYYSIDEYERGPEDDMHVPNDYLHAINVASLPPHELRLKVGAVVMLVRNIDVQEGLCNGVRFRVVSMQDYHITVKKIEASSDQEDYLIYNLPRMNSRATEGTHLPSGIKRLQFPIRLAHAMTINKAQGQTFEKVGIYLEEPCFAHGQVYVAMSRVGASEDVKVLIADSSKHGSFNYRKGRKFTRNVVYKEVILSNPLNVALQQLSPDQQTVNMVAESDKIDDLLMDSWDVDEAFDTLEVLMEQNEIETFENAGDVHARVTTNHTFSQLRKRVSTMDQAGTSGLNIGINPIYRPPIEEDSDEE